MNSNSWQLVFCGISHKTSTLKQRELLQLSSDEIARACALFGNQDEVLESAILSTCNRVEFYFTTPKTSQPFDTIVSFYRNLRDVDASPFRELFRILKDKYAAEHIFRVSSGIDSMVLGENQIVSQMRDSYSSACATRTAGKVVHRLFHQAFRIGKRVRSNTEMGKGAHSVSSAAVSMLQSRIETMTRPRILFVGINQMVELASKRLCNIDGSRLMFANRTRDKAVAFAARYGAEGHGLEQLPDLVAEADVLISCTSSDVPVITELTVGKAIQERSDGKLIIMDLAVPRDVDLPKDRFPQVEINDLDDIKRFVNDQQQRRVEAIPHAEEIIDRKLDEFDYWYQHVLNEPIYNGHRNSVESIRQEELMTLLPRLTPEIQTELNRVTQRMVERVFKMASRDLQGKSKRG